MTPATPTSQSERLSFRHEAPQPAFEYRTAVGKWLARGESLDGHGGHETQFARVLDEFLRIVDDHCWPTALAERTLAKYTLLAEAAARTGELR